MYRETRLQEDRCSNGAHHHAHHPLRHHPPPRPPRTKAALHRRLSRMPSFFFPISASDAPLSLLHQQASPTLLIASSDLTTRLVAQHKSSFNSLLFGSWIDGVPKPHRHQPPPATDLFRTASAPLHLLHTTLLFLLNTAGIFGASTIGTSTDRPTNRPVPALPKRRRKKKVVNLTNLETHPLVGAIINSPAPLRFNTLSEECRLQGKALLLARELPRWLQTTPPLSLVTRKLSTRQGTPVAYSLHRCLGPVEGRNFSS